MDQWETHMQLPEDVHFPAMERLEAQGVSFDRQYCTVPICTPSRATMWTGVHAKHTGLWDNTNFAWIDELSSEISRPLATCCASRATTPPSRASGTVRRWRRSEDALERYGFADFQQWGEMFGAPLEGEQLDGAATFETVDWLEHRAPHSISPGCWCAA